MDLPLLKETELLTFNYLGYDIQVHYPNYEDLDFIFTMYKDESISAELKSLRTLAHLMTGYKSSEEENYIFLKSIPTKVYGDSLRVNDILKELGLIEKNEADKKKEELNQTLSSVQ